MPYSTKTLAEVLTMLEFCELNNMPKPEGLVARHAELLANPPQPLVVVPSATPIYDKLKEHYEYGEMPQEKMDCIESTAKQLLADVPNADEPGLLLGKIQCGKTDTFEHIIALCFDMGIDIAVVLTKGTIPLLEQTVSRMKRDYRYFEPTDDIVQNTSIRIHDIHAIKNGLREANVNKCKTVIVCMKQSVNMDYLLDLFNKKSPFLKEKKVIVIDDEADFASRNYLRVKPEAKYDDNGNIVVQEAETTMAKISKKIDEFRQLPKVCRYLQVTATPYALFLQPNQELYLDGNKVLSFKPRFTTLVPTHSAYVGGEHYFVKSQNVESMYSHLFNPIDEKCIRVLGHEDKRYLNASIASANIYSLTYAVVSYLMATAIRCIQRREKDGKTYKSCALLHIKIDKKNHDWQRRVIARLIDDISNYIIDGDTKDERMRTALEKAYTDFAESNRKAREFDGLVNEVPELPSKEAVIEEMRDIFISRNLHTQVVNSDEEVKHLLDEKSGELRLDTTATIFIGGNVLDRGITIKNMLCFFYGRTPNQQDTVLQHARFYGARSAADMAVTRLHTTERIYEILSRMNTLDNQLRQWFLDGNSNGNAAFVGYDKAFRPCATSKIKISNTLMIKPGKRFLPIGFWTGSRKQISKTVNEIDNIIESLPSYAHRDAKGFFEIDKETALKILNLIDSTYVYDDKYGNTSHKNDIKQLICALEYCTTSSNGKIYALHRTERKINRIRENGRFENAPDGTETALAREKAVDAPVISFLRQVGAKKLNEYGDNIGWNDAEFYWPVLMPHENLNTVLFAIDQKPKGLVAAIDIPTFLGDIDQDDVLSMTMMGNLIDHFGEVGSEYGGEETRALKDSTAGKYIYKNLDGKWELNPNVKIDEASFAGLYSYNNGKFPFVLKPYKYMLLRNRHDAYANLMLLELADPTEWEVVPWFENIDEHGDLYDYENPESLLFQASDTIVDEDLNKTEYVNENACQWIIHYRFKKVVKYHSASVIFDDEEDSEE